jgi:hypothetical protein
MMSPRRYAPAVEVLGDLRTWRVALRSGSLLEVWAHGYTERGGLYVFEMLVGGGEEPSANVLMLDRTPDFARMLIAVARLHTSEVDNIRAA